MKKLVTVFVLVSAMCLPLVADKTQSLLQGVAEKAKGSIVILSWRVKDEISSYSRGGIGICITSNGWFMTPSISPQTRPEMIKDIEIILPGAEHTRIKAKLLGIDPATQMSFIQAEGSRSWNPIAFVKNSELALGSQVVSFGLNQLDPQWSPQLGTGYISSIVYTPEKRMNITGGLLGSFGSVVFDSKKRAVGIVVNQPFSMYQMMVKGRTVSVRLRSDSLGRTFMPAEEFAYILSQIPQDGQTRKLPWIGVGTFVPLSEELADVRGIVTPAVMLDQVIPGQAAADAGLRNGDIVVSLNGKPLVDLGDPMLVAAEFGRAMMRLPIGSEVTLGVFRGNTRQDVKVKLQQSPMRPSQAKRFLSKELGLIVREKVMLDRYLSKDPTAGVDGLIVIGVGKESPADKGKLRQGDLVTMVNALPVKTVKEFDELIEKALAQKTGSDILFMVQRGEDKVPLTVKNPK